MEYQDPPRGLILDLITPIESGDAIDIGGLQRLLEKVAEHVHGILIASPWAGQGNILSLKVRKQLLEGTMAIAPRALPLFVWITGKDEAETRRNLIALQKVTESRQYDAPIYWVDTPLLYHSNRGLPTLYDELFRLAERPFILVNDPQSVALVRSAIKRKNIRTSILKEMATMDLISGLIFLGSMDRAYNYQKAVRKHSNFRIYDGDEARFLEFPSLSGVVSPGANLAPEKWKIITESSLHLNESASDYPDTMKQLWDTGQFLHELRDFYSSNPPAAIKWALVQTGILEGIYDTEWSGTDEKGIRENLIRLLSQ